MASSVKKDKEIPCRAAMQVVFMTNGAVDNTRMLLAIDEGFVHNDGEYYPRDKAMRLIAKNGKDEKVRNEAKRLLKKWNVSETFSTSKTVIEIGHRRTLMRNTVLFVGVVFLFATIFHPWERVRAGHPLPVNASPQPQSSESMPKPLRTARIAAFVADKEGKLTHDFPAWNEFRKIVDDSPAARALLSELIIGEPSLLEEIGGDSKELIDSFSRRVDALHDIRGKEWRMAFGTNQKPKYSATVPSTLALVFVASLPEVGNKVNFDSKLEELILASQLVEWDVFEGASCQMAITRLAT